jgi:outer membrane immunogenic protein
MWPNIMREGGISRCNVVEFPAVSLLEMTVKRLLAVSCLAIVALIAAVSANAQGFGGFYIGGYAGGSVNNSVAQTTTVFASTGYFATTSVPAIASVGNMTFNPHAINGGGEVGWNFVFGHFMIGPELDFGSLRNNVTATGTAGYPCCSPTTFTVTQSMKTRGMFTARARVGFVWGHIMFFGTGGVALTNMNAQQVFSDTFANATEHGGAKVDKAGWVGGGGAEISLSRHWSIKGEFLYANFGTLTSTSTNLVTTGFIGGGITSGVPTTTSWPQNPFTQTVTLTEKIGRGGINFHF